MNTIRRYAADDAHVIYGTAYDESLGDQLRVTVIATGLNSGRRSETRTPPLSVVAPVIAAPMAQPVLRTGTDNLPILTQPAAAVSAPTMAAPAVAGLPAGITAAPALPQHDYNHMASPSVWRTRAQASAKVDSLANSGMDEIEIPAFLRRQAD
jgi:cell division protein FtsZ